MAMDLPKLRKLLALDPEDPLSRFALGRKLFETDPTAEGLTEAAEHLHIANTKAPEHLATYHVLGQVLMKLGRKDEARDHFQRALVIFQDLHKESPEARFKETTEQILSNLKQLGS